MTSNEEENRPIKIQLFSPNVLRIEKILSRVKQTLTSFLIPSAQLDYISSSYQQLIETIPLTESQDADFDSFWESWVPFREDAIEHCSHPITEICHKYLEEEFEQIYGIISTVKDSIPQKMLHRKEYEETAEKLLKSIKSMEKLLYSQFKQNMDTKQTIKDLLLQRTKIRRLKTDITTKYSSIFEITQKQDLQTDFVNIIDHIFNEINNLPQQDKALQSMNNDLADAEETIISQFPLTNFQFERLKKQSESIYASPSAKMLLDLQQHPSKQSSKSLLIENESGSDENDTDDDDNPSNNNLELVTRNSSSNKPLILGQNFSSKNKNSSSNEKLKTQARRNSLEVIDESSENEEESNEENATNDKKEKKIKISQINTPPNYTNKKQQMNLSQSEIRPEELNMSQSDNEENNNEEEFSNEEVKDIVMERRKQKKQERYQNNDFEEEEEEDNNEYQEEIPQQRHNKRIKHHSHFDENDEYLKQSGFSPEKDSKEYLFVESSETPQKSPMITPHKQSSSMMKSRHDFTPLASEGSDSMRNSPALLLNVHDDDLEDSPLRQKRNNQSKEIQEYDENEEISDDDDGDDESTEDERNPMFDSEDFDSDDDIKQQPKQQQKKDKPPYIPVLTPTAPKYNNLIGNGMGQQPLPKTPQPDSKIKPLDLNKENTNFDLDMESSEDDQSDDSDEPLIEPFSKDSKLQREIATLKKRLKQNQEDYENIRIQLEASFEETQDLMDENEQLKEKQAQLEKQIKKLKLIAESEDSKVVLEPVVFKTNTSSDDDESGEGETKNNSSLTDDAQENMMSKRIDFLEKERTALLQNIDRITEENIRLQKNQPSTDDTLLQENADLKERLHIFSEIQELLLIELKRRDHGQESNTVSLITELERMKEEVHYLRTLRNKTLTFESERIFPQQTEDQLRVANKTLEYENERTRKEILNIKKINEDLKKELSELKLQISPSNSKDTTEFEGLRKALFVSQMDTLQAKMQLQKIASLSLHLKAKVKRLKQKTTKEEIDESIKEELKHIRDAYNQSVEWGYEQQKLALDTATKLDNLKQKQEKQQKEEKKPKLDDSIDAETLETENKWLKKSILKIINDSKICSNEASYADMVNTIYNTLVHN